MNPSGYYTLTPREQEVFDLSRVGMRCKEIARALVMCTNSVTSYRTRIKKKMGPKAWTMEAK